MKALVASWGVAITGIALFYIFRGLIVYILLLIGISKWARRWEREPPNWVVVGVFFSPVIAAVLLLMYGSRIDKDILVDKKIDECKTYLHSQMNEIISVIKSRIPLQFDDKTPTESKIDVNIDLSQDDQEPEDPTSI